MTSPDAWLHKYRRTDGGSRYEQVNISMSEPAPKEGYEWAGKEPLYTAPIDMVLHCPACGLQHIDRDEGQHMTPHDNVWRNPPHRSHLCAGCGYVWRPADVPTNGVTAIKTVGRADSPFGADKRVALTDGDEKVTANQALGECMYAAISQPAAPAERVTLTDEQINESIVRAARAADCVAEACRLVDYDPDIGRVPEHWVPFIWVQEIARAPPMPARLNDQRIVELMRPLADDALIRPHVIAAARAAIAEHERLNGISATPRQPLSEARIEEGRHETFSTNNPFCPCDSKTMLKAVRWAERAHGITPAQGKEHGDGNAR